MHANKPLLPILLLLTTLITLLSPPPSASARLDSFIYVGCSQRQYTPNTPYESNLNSILSSLVNSASLSLYNTFKINLVYGLFQCRGDLPLPACHRCIAAAVTRLGTYCNGASGGALQLEGCFVRYGDTNFVGVEDKSVVSEKCGESVGYDSDLFMRRDGVLEYLGRSGGGYFRVGGSGRVQGVVQCVEDLSVGECQDCLGEAIGRLKSVCGSSMQGDMFLGKCYARYSARGFGASRGKMVNLGFVHFVCILVVFVVCTWW